MKRLMVFVALAGCTQTAPAPPAPRAVTEVSASFDRTWEATIDHFAASNIPIANMDRASGFIASQDLLVAPQDGTRFADCGSVMGMAVPASRVVFNVLVRGDDATSTVRVTPSYRQGSEGAACSTSGVWEAELETSIKNLAEG